jgi:hypothetical protein
MYPESQSGPERRACRPRRRPCRPLRRNLDVSRVVAVVQSAPYLASRTQDEGFVYGSMRW